MPLISSKGLYGLNAMVELVHSTQDHPVQVREISSNASIPQNYLEQLLRKLKQADLIKSIRGSKGGYFLALDASNILVKDIIIALEGDIKVTDIKSDSFILNLFFETTKNKINELFDLSLFDLYSKYQKQYHDYLHYNI